MELFALSPVMRRYAVCSFWRPPPSSDKMEALGSPQAAQLQAAAPPPTSAALNILQVCCAGTW